ncbi:MAG: hypothetical protein WD200_02345 [Candidatus Andersenbacteria bacterium]
MIYLDTKTLIIALAVVILLFLFARYRRKAFVPFALALLVATVWSFYFRYEYNGSNLFLMDRINVYPLILWTVGLTGLQLTSYEFPKRYRLALVIILYLILLIAAEAIGYHFLNIRLNSRYTSLLNLGVIHAPVIMKMFYIFAGPVYLAFLSWLDRRGVLGAINE